MRPFGGEQAHVPFRAFAFSQSERRALLPPGRAYLISESSARTVAPKSHSLSDYRHGGV
jgi:hypothetical protein